MKHTLTVADVVDLVSEEFSQAEGLYYGHGTETADDEAYFLVFHVCALPFDSDERVWSKMVSEAQFHHIQMLTHRRIEEKIPMPYLLNTAWFAGLKFYVDQRVLVPRSPFGEIIQNHFEPWLDTSNIHRVLDLCTGSGCMAIATAYALPHVKIDAVDISADALAVAKRNVHDHHLDHRIRLIESDVFSSLQNQQYDLIISNPPYVDAQDMETLPAEYHHEPTIGLSSGTDGLDVTKKILQQAKDHLTSEGVLIVEVGNSFPALEAQYPHLPFTWIDIHEGEDGIFVLYRKDLF